MKHTPPTQPLRTPDGRYLLVRGRLWRASNPNLPPSEHERLIQALTEARREVARAKKRSNPELRARARAHVDEIRRKLGELGPPWWDDGAPDYNRRMVHNTPYADWFADLPAETREAALADV